MLQHIRFAAVGLLLLPTVADAQTYFSIDTTNDILCAVDVTNGLVTYLGPLQADLENCDLAWHQGALYAQTWTSPVGSKIYQIVDRGHYVGYALQGGALNGGGYSVGALGGIASNGTALHLAYSQSNPNNNYAGSFGTIAANWQGTIVQVGATIAPTFDIDSMGFGWGEFWGVDVLQPGGTAWRLYHGTVSPTTLVPGSGSATYDVATNPVDIEVLDANRLIAVSQNGQNLIPINRTTGLPGASIPLVGLQPNGVLKGIALRPNPCGRLIVLPATPLSHP